MAKRESPHRGIHHTGKYSGNKRVGGHPAPRIGTRPKGPVFDLVPDHDDGPTNGKTPGSSAPSMP